MFDRINAANDTKHDLAPRKHPVSMVFRALIDTLYHFRHAIAAVGALIVMVLMVCGPGACRHPLLYVLGWLVYIPLGVFACIPLIDRIGVAVDRMEKAERHG